MEFWPLVAILSSLSLACYVYANQLLRLDAVVGIMYRTVGVFVCLLPFVWMFKPIDNIYFYIICAIQGFAIYYRDYKIFALSKKIGAESTSLYQPLSIIMIFFGWIFMHPEAVIDITDDITSFVIQLVCLLAISYSLLCMKQDKETSSIITILIPVVLFTILIDIINKKSMDIGGYDLAAAIFYYHFIVGGISGLCSIIMYKHSRIHFNFFSKKMIIYGILLMVVIFGAVITKNIAMYYTPNPAYVSAITGLIPIWIAFFDYILIKCGVPISTHHPKLKYIFILVASVSVMIIYS